MQFDWNEANISHLQAHDIEPSEVVEAMTNDPLPLSSQEVCGEVRYVVAGQTDTGRVLRIIWTLRSGRIRPITAHESRKLRRLFRR